MTEHELIEKLSRDERLTHAEQAVLDAALESESQTSVASAVRALQEESLSLAWRSALNERLIAEAKPARSRWSLLWQPAVGFGLAGALAAVLFVTQGNNGEVRPSNGASLEAALIKEHVEGDQFVQLAGAGLNLREARPAPIRTSDYDWTEVDLETL